jgi:Trm5-related predicted tRNA methylase
MRLISKKTPLKRAILNTQGKEDVNTRLYKEKQFKKSPTIKQGGKRQCQEESL